MTRIIFKKDLKNITYFRHVDKTGLVESKGLFKKGNHIIECEIWKAYERKNTEQSFEVGLKKNLLVSYLRRMLNKFAEEKGIKVSGKEFQIYYINGVVQETPYQGLRGQTTFEDFC